MGRLHLLELEDQPWFPAGIRNLMTDFLDFVANLSQRPYEGFAEKLRDALAEADEHEITDLCSGGSGPVVTLVRMLGERHGYPVTARLTDLYPNAERFRALHSADGALTYVEEPVDARAVPPSLGGLRLLSNSFHHFRPEDARGILTDAVASRRAVAVFELVGRSLPAFLSVAFVPFTVLVTTPFIRPFRWRRLFWTYLVPLVPFCCLWDGIVSCLRVYSPREMEALFAELPPNDYRCKAGTLPTRGGPAVTYFLAVPRQPRVLTWVP